MAPSTPRSFPTLRGHWLTGIARPFRRDPLGFLLDAGERHEPGVRLHFSPFNTMTLVTDPNLVEHVLLGGPERYPKVEMRMERLQSAIIARLRDKLDLTGAAPPPRFNRKLAAPLMSPAHIEHCLHRMHRRFEGLVDQWSRCSSGEVLDLSPALNRLALEIAIETMLGSTLDPAAAKTVADAMTQVSRAIAGLMSSRVRLPPFVPTPQNRALQAALGDLADVVYDYRQAVRATPNDGTLSLFSLPDRVLRRSEATELDVLSAGVTLLISAHETSWTTMAWTLGFLAQHPRHGNAVAQQAEHVLGEGPFETSMIPRLDLCRQAVDESLRLRSPTWITMRQAVADDTWRGYSIPRGTRLILSPYVVHQLSRCWDEPQVFRPERFAGGEAPARGAYLPFGHGSRNCIGKHFGRSEAVLLISMLMRRIRFEPVPGHDYSPKVGVAVHPRGGMKLRIHPRTSGGAVAA